MGDNRKVADDDGVRQRVAFFLGASGACGWEIAMDDLFTLGRAPRSLAECVEMIAAMKAARSDGRVAAGLRVVSERIDREMMVRSIVRGK